MNRKTHILPDLLTGIYTDYYELTMVQGYYLEGKHEQQAVFDYFFRKNPFDGGYTIFAGLANLLDLLKNITFPGEVLEYLSARGFKEDFLHYLSVFKFSGDIFTVREGEVVFPNEPVARVEGSILETQLVESLLLNILNFESLIATKASRIREAAGDAVVSDFGLRRAQGIASIQASRAAIIGGVDNTSNVASAFLYNMVASGTMAHSWIQSFPDELLAFRKFAQLYPDNCVLLVDTYDTLASGVPNAITVAREMETEGEKILGIRLDSGDLAFISRKARKMLDEAGMSYVKIVASNQLDEQIIRSLEEQGAAIDVFGVGTKLITGYPDAALDGVYKISVSHGDTVMKLSENIEKSTFPGRKNILRFINGEDKFAGDAVVLEEEENVDEYFHPFFSEKKKNVKGLRNEKLLKPVMKGGEIITPDYAVSDIATYAKTRMARLDDSHKRFENPHVYKVGISRKLLDLRNDVKHKIRSGYIARNRNQR